MIRRLCAASTVVLLGVIASPAAAKPGHVEGFRELRGITLSGPGMLEMRRVGGDTRLARTLLRHTGMHLALMSREPLSTAGSPMTNERGPRYVVSYTLTDRAAGSYGVDGTVVRQYLFPYADERPWAFIPAGQGPGTARRWWPVSIQLVPLYDRLGLPHPRAIEVTRTGDGAAAGGAPAGGDGPRGPDAVTWIAAAFAGVVLASTFRRWLGGGATRRA